MELVLAPLVMGGFGWLLDGWIGTDPFLAIGFGAFGIAGIFTKLVTGYDKAMAVAQQGKPWMRDTAPGRPADEAAGITPPSPPAPPVRHPRPSSPPPTPNQ